MNFLDNLKNDLFQSYWSVVAKEYYQHGDYQWMLDQLGIAEKIIEIGCGFGYSAATIIKNNRHLLSLDNDQLLINLAKDFIAENFPEQNNSANFILTDFNQLSEIDLCTIKQFQADTLICWMIGDSNYQQEIKNDEEQAKIRYLNQEKILELALQFESIKQIQIVDRTVIPWQAKDTTRKIVYDQLQKNVIKNKAYSLNINQIKLRKMRYSQSSDAQIFDFRQKYRAAKNVAAVFISTVITKN